MNNVRNYIWYLETENPLVNFREVQTVVEGRAGAGAWISAACLCLIGFQQHTLTYFNIHQHTAFFSAMSLSIFWGLLFWFLEAGSSIDFSSPLILSPLQSTMDLFVGTKSRYSNFSMASCAVGWVTATKLSSSSHHLITIVTKISIFWFSRGWLCCWVPFCTDDCKNFSHFCPLCGQLMGEKSTIRDET